MAWNRPSEDKVKVRGEGEQRNVHLKGLLAGMIVVLGAAFAAWWLWPRGGSAGETPQSETRPRIAEVAPAAAPESAPVSQDPANSRKKLGRDWRQKQISIIEQKYGTNLTADLKAALHYLKNPPQRSFKPRTEYSFLSHPSERMMYSLLSAEPGAYMLEPVQVGESFNQDFVNALLDKIEIAADDSDEVRRIKQFVAEAKKEMAELVRSEGKKPSELLNEHARSLYELGRFQQNLERELNAARKNADLSDQDVEDMYKAANVLRKQRGLEELPIPSLTRRARQLQRQLARDAKRAAQKETDTKTKEISK